MFFTDDRIGSRRLGSSFAMNTQNNAGWFLDRLSSPYGDGQYNYTYDGTGVVLYVFGSGMRITHNEFGGRASCGFTVGTNCKENTAPNTGVASLAGGKTLGAAKNITIKAVKIYNDSDQYRASYGLRAVDYLVKEKRKNPTTPMIILARVFWDDNFRSWRVKRAFNKLTNLGFIVVAGAGDESQTRCNKIPQGLPNCITVVPTNAANSVDQSDSGSCIDLLAPGLNVTVALSTNDTDYGNYNGSSAAAGLVAGVVGLYLQKYPTWNSKQVATALKQDAIKDAITIPTSKLLPNLLVCTDNITKSATP